LQDRVHLCAEKIAINKLRSSFFIVPRTSLNRVSGVLVFQWFGLVRQISILAKCTCSSKTLDFYAQDYQVNGDEADDDSDRTFKEHLALRKIVSSTPAKTKLSIVIARAKIAQHLSLCECVSKLGRLCSFMFQTIGQSLVYISNGFMHNIT
jgi:hypothetical protein